MRPIWKPTPTRRAGVAAAAGVLLAATAAACEAAPRSDGLDPRIVAIMTKPAYRHAQWGLLEVDPSGHQVGKAMSPDQFFIPGSVAKLFSVSAAWKTLGGDHRSTTPVYAAGSRQGATLSGNLVLVAQGDLTMGGRTKPDGGVDFTTVDHTYANDIPGATLTPEDPLAGLDQIAAQVRHAGITRVAGDVVVDDRLFAAPRELDPRPTPLIINDNVIDLLIAPGRRAGAPAKLTWRPRVAPYHVTSDVKTVATGKPTDIEVSASSDGTRISVSGTIAAAAEPVLRVSSIADPAAFGRTALIEALARAGVTVTAAPTGANPAGKLPASYRGDPRVAAYVSPPYAEYAKLIFKVSHNLGANLAICQMAVSADSHDCEAGFGVLASFLRRAGVDTRQVQLLDGRGGNPVDRVTPTAVTQVLRYWARTPEARRFREALPILGVDGSLAGSCQRCPAKGKVFAKTGTVAGFDAVNEQLAVGGETLGGYLDTGGGRFDVFYAGVTGAAAPDVEGVLGIADDAARISAYLQEDASRDR